MAQTWTRNGREVSAATVRALRDGRKVPLTNKLSGEASEFAGDKDIADAGQDVLRYEEMTARELDAEIKKLGLDEALEAYCQNNEIKNPKVQEKKDFLNSRK